METAVWDWFYATGDPLVYVWGKTALSRGDRESKGR